MMHVAITKIDSGSLDRTVAIDDEGFEYGKDLTGRTCRVAHHGRSIVRHLRQFGQGVAFRTSGQTYTLVSG